MAQAAKKDPRLDPVHGQQPRVPVYAGFDRAEVRAALRRKEEPSYMGTFTSARRHVLHTFAHTQSALMKRRVAQYMVGQEAGYPRTYVRVTDDSNLGAWNEPRTRELVGSLAQAGVDVRVYVRRWADHLPDRVRVEPGFTMI